MSTAVYPLYRCHCNFCNLCRQLRYYFATVPKFPKSPDPLLGCGGAAPIVQLRVPWPTNNPPEPDLAETELLLGLTLLKSPLPVIVATGCTVLGPLANSPDLLPPKAMSLLGRGF